MKIYALPEPTYTALVNYMAGRPYAEVANGMAALLALKPLPEAPVAAPAAPAEPKADDNSN